MAELDDLSVANLEDGNSGEEYGIASCPPRTENDDVTSLMGSFDTDDGFYQREGLQLAWKDVQIEAIGKRRFCGLVPPKQSSRVILQKCSGIINPGSLVAVMGSSGSGKTTLLNSLNGRVPDGCSFSGQVYIDGVPLNASQLRKMSAYVMQDDMMFPLLTVKDTIFYASQFRLPSSMSDEDKSQRVKQVIADLGLRHCQNSIVGNASIRGVSGGERKRVSIGIELVTDPGLLFLDEPTSGLDSKNALSLMENLAYVAHKRKYTVITTIHQPRSAIFKKFDALILLAGGRICYFGPAADAMAYFSRIGYPAPIHDNPADYYIDLLTLDVKKEEESKERIKEMQDAYTPIPFKIQDPNHTRVNEWMKNKRGGAWDSFLWLCDRSLKSILRDRQFLTLRIVQTAAITLALSILFFQIDTNQASIPDRNGLLIICLMNMSFNEMMVVLAVFPGERDVFNRERACNSYSVLSYYIAKQMAELPMQIALPVIFSSIVYWTTGLQADFWKFGVFLTTIFACSMVANSLGLFLAASLPLKTASAVAPIAILATVMFAGFFIAIDNIVVFLRWLSHLSFVRYGYLSLMQAEYGGLELHCDSDEYIETPACNGYQPEFICDQFVSCNGTRIEVPCHMNDQYSSSVSGDNRVCPFTTGEQVLKEYDADAVEIYWCVTILFGLCALLRILTYFSLKYIRPSSG